MFRAKLKDPLVLEIDPNTASKNSERLPPVSIFCFEMGGTRVGKWRGKLERNVALKAEKAMVIGAAPKTRAIEEKKLSRLSGMMLDHGHHHHPWLNQNLNYKKKNHKTWMGQSALTATNIWI